MNVLSSTTTLTTGKLTATKLETKSSMNIYSTVEVRILTLNYLKIEGKLSVRGLLPGNLNIKNKCFDITLIMKM